VKKNAKMEKHQDGMPPDHFRAGKTHHFLDAFAIGSLVAVHGTVGAGGFLLTERAPLQTFIGVGAEIGTCGAKFSSDPMPSAAIIGDHGADQLSLARQRLSTAWVLSNRFHSLSLQRHFERFPFFEFSEAAFTMG
jgi:hypothetical protein